jgi:two-component system cell cycle response regulator DivK
MSRLSPFDKLAALRDEARILVQRASDHEHDLHALVAAAEMHVRHAEDALSDALEGTRRSVEHLRLFLPAVLQRSQAGVDSARQVYASAHEQHVAADVLLTHLEDHFSQEQMIERRPRRDAVLVVDDYGAVREVIADVLRHAGFVVRTAANGLEGLLVAHEMRPAVIVMDLTMPVLDGMTATRLIKASEATHNARVIAYTADLVPDRSLFTAVVQKPATPADLLATVRQVAHL